MKIEVIAYGIAKDIINGASLTMDVAAAVSVGTIREALLADYPAFAGLASLQLAVNAEYVNDEFVLKENDEVVIIPPVSGG
jgi:molybdopterin converting factor small subunit